ncbi:MAG TPA: hypothetical protein VMI11_10520 [Actinomycetes bacterium]|nr:hypothetical protein [Actinomycetes bacterium]
MTTSGDAPPRPVVGTPVLLGLGTTTLAVLVGVELLLGLGLLWAAILPITPGLRVLAGALWLAPFVLGAVVWRWVIRPSADRSLAVLASAGVAVVMLFPYAILGAIGWFV